MKAKLSYGIISADLKQSYVVMIDDVFYRNRTRVEKDTLQVELSCMEGIDKLTSSFPVGAYGCIVVPIDIAKQNVVKFIATYKSNDKDVDIAISHESSSNIEDFINQLDGDISGFDALRTKQEIHIGGKVEYICTLPRINDICIVTEIGIIDKFKLYNPADRQAKIIKIDRYNLQIQLINSKQFVNCKREHFKILRLDKFYLFNVYCPYCKR